MQRTMWFLCPGVYQSILPRDELTCCDNLIMITWAWDSYRGRWWFASWPGWLWISIYGSSLKAGLKCILLRLWEIMRRQRWQSHRHKLLMISGNLACLKSVLIQDQHSSCSFRSCVWKDKSSTAIILST